MKEAKNPIKVNFANHTIVISRLFAVRAAIPTSTEYVKLTDIQTSYPDYKIEVKTIKKSDKENYKGLTYAYMEYYISTHENPQERMAEYKEIRLRAACHSMKYGHIKKWFLATYPQIDDFTPEQFLEETVQNNDNNFEICIDKAS